MDQIASALAAKARDTIGRASACDSGASVMRAEVTVPGLDGLAWLRAQRNGPKFYWCDRSAGDEIAGLGAVDRIGCDIAESPSGLFAVMEERLHKSDPACRYFGGMRFTREGIREPVWQRFGGAHFVLPRFEAINTGPGSVLACHWRSSSEDAELMLKELAALSFSFENSRQVKLEATGRLDIPDASEWREDVAETLGLLSRGHLEKLVLARKSVFQFTRHLDPLACLEALSEKADRCYRFCFMPAPDLAFLGVSPERLYRREGRRVLTEAIAGTRVRGSEPLADERLARELMANEKEQREHAYVVRGVTETVAPLCSTLRPSCGVSILKLEECQHLMSVFEGELRDRVGDADLLGALQPTPAVGGYPTAVAIPELARIERFDRGWYAGPMGWMGKAGAEFTVAIRSGLIEGSQLSLFAGAGIVEGSIAEAEWQELDNKIRHFTRVLKLS